ncbi:alpha/beta fold hydrolase [Paenibacillus sp. J22TS3]|uniref:alpha/beta hydrolase n=1 Tax=Paenibacillus sp. J22TS3 TaxID=2807192 RepID=UPI001B164921|nr:alpha/beta hydrolase [Paenibacillus sp. J22TS3]GIP23859.1 hypothetical protein J22TS3_41340 [Paenibacillus sp. J22TS3]
MTTPNEQNTKIIMKPRKPRKSRWIKIVLGVLAFMLILVGAGFGYEWYASKKAEADYPPPGKLVDVGGFRLHILKKGTGSPTILLEAASGETSQSWRKIPDEIAKFATVVSYDRGGFGWSDKAVTARTGPNIAQEFHTALKREGIQGPYIIVGHSLGGMYARLFAQEYQQEMAGLVLVDAKPVGDDLKTAPILEQEHFQKPTPSSGISKLLKQSGAMRLFKDILLEGLVRKEDRDVFVNVIAQPKYFDAVDEEAKNIPITEERLKNQHLGKLPVRVITRGQIPPEVKQMGLSPDAGRKIEEIWQAGQRDLLKISEDSKMIVAKNSGHYIIHDEPGVVVDVIGQLVKELSQKPLSTSSTAHR